MKKITLVFALLSGLSFVASGQNGVSGSSKLDTIIDRTAHDFIKGNSWTSFSVGLVAGGKISWYNYGSVQKDKNQLPDNESIYEIGSITKTFSSLLLAHAVLEKKVKLDDDIRKYLKGGYPNLQYGKEPVRLIHLVNLTSRLPDNLPDKPEAFNNVSANSIPFVIAKVHNGYTKEDLLNDLHQARLDTLPGLIPRHSNVAGQLLGYILENIYHKSYDELVKEYITGPLKMNNTFITVPKNKIELMVKGYNEKGTPMPYIPADAKAAGGMHSCIADLTTYMKYNLDEKDPAVKMTHQVAWGDVNTFALGLNWFINKTGDGKLTIHDDGTTLAFTTYFMMYPELHFGIVITTNVNSPTSNNQLGELAQRIFNESHYTPEQIASEGFGLSASINKLLNVLNKRGFAHAMEVANELKKENSQFMLNENEINNWAYSLSGKGKKDKALEILKLNVSLYPNSYNVYDSLAEIYENVGNKELAIKNFKRSLELNPKNTNAVDHLKQLE